ncbi:hypothetical protein D3C80_1729300 [compost metagenome]
MLLRNGQCVFLAKQFHRLRPAIQESDKIRSALQGCTAPYAEKMVIQHPFFAGRNPCQVISQRWVIRKKIIQPAPLEHAQGHR